MLVIGAVVWSSTVGRRRQVDTRRLAEHERTWFGIVTVLLVTLLFATIFFTPYGRGRESNDPRLQVLSIKAVQFAFLVPPTAVHVGRPVQFRLTSTDVNHGFAVFDPHHTFLFQVQVIPGRTQLYRYTFKKPGIYSIECFEYCGIGHDHMAGQIRVVA